MAFLWTPDIVNECIATVILYSYYQIFLQYLSRVKGMLLVTEVRTTYFKAELKLSENSDAQFFLCLQLS